MPCRSALASHSSTGATEGSHVAPVAATETDRVRHVADRQAANHQAASELVLRLLQHLHHRPARYQLRGLSVSTAGASTDSTNTFSPSAAGSTPGRERMRQAAAWGRPLKEGEDFIQLPQK
ncbi:hypothetical protein TSOC_002186 [Tetrabaena socialis]|uniref:Uncharacterized protein n=1 Tax=Tetrabaena socialis TaxID=47790 RepID=A0A2J8AET6_9CHLO|nr:hypothetical protein TSOC_002186 [Tetrabaena socialis]|eukprot:PNH11030.1 hypothetical protein TSOC_002186 [Tetrabaena socialis]